MNAETALVGAAIVDGKVFTEAALKYNQFESAECQVLWKAIGQLVEQSRPLDEISVSDATGGKLSPSEVGKYTRDVGVPNVANWCQIVRNDFTTRRLDELSKGLQNYSALDKLAKMRQRLEDLEHVNKRELPTLADVATSEAERIRSTPLSEVRGLPSGIGIERVVPGGISRGRVTTLFGESGNFKTTVKNNIVYGISSAGYRVLDVSLEDANELTAHRFIARLTGLNYGRISAGALRAEEKDTLVIPPEAFEAAANVVMAGDILPNIDEIIRVARSTPNIDAVVIDYVQLVYTGNSRHNEKERLDCIMRACQLAAKRDNMAYIIVSQVKQDVDQRTDHRPRISDMIGSSAMRTASKLSIGVYRPSLYHEVPVKGGGYENLFHNHPSGPDVYSGILELHYLKNVLGAPRVVTHCLVNAGTGVMENFDMRAWL